MALDVILTLITLVVAIIGTLLRDPPERVKVFLIALAIAASIGSVVKAREDATEKAFLRSAVTSTLVPDGKVYGKLQDQVSSQAKSIGLNDSTCYHTDEGMTCFLSNASQTQHGTLIFSRSEIAELYADYLQHKTSSAAIARAFNQPYLPADFSDEFEEKASLMGSAVVYQKLHSWPNSSYDDHGGQDLELQFLGSSKQILVRFSAEELRAFGSGTAPQVFYALEQALRRKLLEQGM